MSITAFVKTFKKLIDHWCKIIPSRVSGQGYEIGPVCLSVCQCAHSWIVWHTDANFGKGMHFDHISDDFEGHRSRSPSWKTLFLEFQMGWHLQIHFTMTYHVMLCHGVTSWRHIRHKMSWFAGPCGPILVQSVHGPACPITSRTQSSTHEIREEWLGPWRGGGGLLSP